VHDNVFVDVAGTAIVLRNHDLSLKLAHVYNNTIYAAGEGIYFGSAASQGAAVVGNLGFSPLPIGGSAPPSQGNLVDLPGNAGSYVKAASATPGVMDFYPLPGKCQGPALDLSTFSGQTDFARDFNGTSKGAFTFRGAYAGEGTNPGWGLAAALKEGGSLGRPRPPSAPEDGARDGGGGGGCGATGLEGLLILGLRKIFRRRRIVALPSLSRLPDVH
jgi:hypothetical protein